MNAMNENKENYIIGQLEELSLRLDKIANTQAILQKQIKMIFADITGFESLVMKVIDRYDDSAEEEDIKSKMAH